MKPVRTLPEPTRVVTVSDVATLAMFNFLTQGLQIQASVNRFTQSINHRGVRLRSDASQVSGGLPRASSSEAKRGIENAQNNQARFSEVVKEAFKGKVFPRTTVKTTRRRRAPKSEVCGIADGTVSPLSWERIEVIESPAEDPIFAGTTKSPSSLYRYTEKRKQERWLKLDEETASSSNCSVGVGSTIDSEDSSSRATPTRWFTQLKDRLFTSRGKQETEPLIRKEIETSSDINLSSSSALVPLRPLRKSSTEMQFITFDQDAKESNRPLITFDQDAKESNRPLNFSKASPDQLSAVDNSSTPQREHFFESSVPFETIVVDKEEWYVPAHLKVIPSTFRQRAQAQEFCFIDSGHRLEIERRVVSKDDEEEIRRILKHLELSRVLAQSANFRKVYHTWVRRRGNEGIEVYFLSDTNDRKCINAPSGPADATPEHFKALGTILSGMAELHSADLIMGELNWNDLELHGDRWVFVNFDKITEAKGKISSAKVNDLRGAAQFLLEWYKGPICTDLPPKKSGQVDCEERINRFYRHKLSNIVKLEKPKLLGRDDGCDISSIESRISTDERALTNDSEAEKINAALDSSFSELEESDTDSTDL